MTTRVDAYYYFSVNDVLFRRKGSRRKDERGETRNIRIFIAFQFYFASQIHIYIYIYLRICRLASSWAPEYVGGCVNEISVVIKKQTLASFDRWSSDRVYPTERKSLLNDDLFTSFTTDRCGFLRYKFRFRLIAASRLTVSTCRTKSRVLITQFNEITQFTIQYLSVVRKRWGKQVPDTEHRKRNRHFFPRRVR